MSNEIAFELLPNEEHPAVVIHSGEWEGVRYHYTDLAFKYADDEGMAKMRFSYEVETASDAQKAILAEDSEPFERLIGNILAQVLKEATESQRTE